MIVSFEKGRRPDLEVPFSYDLRVFAHRSHGGHPHPVGIMRTHCGIVERPHRAPAKLNWRIEVLLVCCEERFDRSILDPPPGRGAVPNYWTGIEDVRRAARWWTAETLQRIGWKPTRRQALENEYRAACVDHARLADQLQAVLDRRQRIGLRLGLLDDLESWCEFFGGV